MLRFGFQSGAAFFKRQDKKANTREETPMQPQLTLERQRQIIMKVSWRLLPLIVLCYLINYIDRTNVSFAALTMNKDLGLSSFMYGLGAGIFFLSYAFFEVPSNIVLQKVGARLWIARIMITWGIISGLMSMATGPISFLALRFALGMAEAGFFPGMIFYLTQWFPAHRPRSRDLHFVHRRTRVQRGGLHHLGRNSLDDERYTGTQRLAVGVHHRSDPGRTARVRRARTDDRPTSAGEVAQTRRARMARRRARG